MSNKRILLVGNGNHQFIKNYAFWIKKKSSNDFVVDVLSSTKLSKDNKDVYNRVLRLNDKFLSITKIKLIRRYFRLCAFKNLINKLPYYDFIHFHYISVDNYFLVEQFKKHTSAKIILSVWGSDIYGLRSVNEKGFIDTCLKADIITFTNQKSLNNFKIKYNWEKEKLKLCRFGLAPLDRLKNSGISRKNSKLNLGWNIDKLAVTIGYNMSPAQQHLKILEHFERNKLLKFKDKIQLILPLTYGGNKKYKSRLLKKLNQLPFEYFIYDKFLSIDKIADLRQASDIMLQLQITDQFSGSMQEHMFTKNVVITGNWLPYDTFKEYGVWFLQIDKLEEVSNVIDDVVKNFSKYQKKTKNNPKIINELSSWDKNIQAWIDIYNN